MIYMILADGTSKIKIGYTGKDPMERLATLQTGSPTKLLLIAYCDGEIAEEIGIHASLAAFRSHGEWFNFGYLSSASGGKVEQPWVKAIARFIRGEIIEDNWAVFLNWREKSLINTAWSSQGRVKEKLSSEAEIRSSFNSLRATSARTMGIRFALQEVLGVDFEMEQS